MLIEIFKDFRGVEMNYLKNNNYLYKIVNYFSLFKSTFVLFEQSSSSSGILETHPPLNSLSVYV